MRDDPIPGAGKIAANSKERFPRAWFALAVNEKHKRMASRSTTSESVRFQDKELAFHAVGG
ncbi:uncharacterized protein PHALS_14320 [Plasmopara halstedii]|uniref:Uncharacterized protein n=1 Tax=Plasmopara halstedii TaxID=4781 RepID=A0A0P1ARQ5_PLAHL|nr:uncharacterized protein PHALS_14320 [Plasmopara halstedii]CEG44050.1 hypothetical protein PHALS_14320 [Plasmopara halstedii]|eukprot:XP_024580419.1 hypothetical protein PHALS_14320 [Plasmopara halstedii]